VQDAERRYCEQNLVIDEGIQKLVDRQRTENRALAAIQQELEPFGNIAFSRYVTHVLIPGRRATSPMRA
jgi:hypothetical protein